MWIWHDSIILAFKQLTFNIRDRLIMDMDMA